MLIALVIFGMITAAGVALLDPDRAHAGDLGAAARFAGRAAADRRPARRRPRPGGAAPARDGDGRPQQAFVGGDGDGCGAARPGRARGLDDGSAFRSSLQRVEYRLRDGRLERWRYDAVDGDGRATAMTLLDNVRQIRLRYRDREGDWHARWDPTNPGPAPRRGRNGQRQRRPGPGPLLFLVGGGR